MTRRLDGVPANEWSKSMLGAISALKPPVAQAPPAGKRRPQGHAALETFAIHPDLAAAFFGFNRHVLWGTTLPTRLRHIVILRVAARRHASFLWGEHEAQGVAAGLTQEEVAGIAVGDVPTFNPLEQALLSSVDELFDEDGISDSTWEVLAIELMERQLLDIVFTAGCYNTVAWMMNSAGLKAGDGGATR